MTAVASPEQPGASGPERRVAPGVVLLACWLLGGVAAMRAVSAIASFYAIPEGSWQFAEAENDDSAGAAGALGLVLVGGFALLVAVIYLMLAALNARGVSGGPHCDLGRGRADPVRDRPGPVPRHLRHHRLVQPAHRGRRGGHRGPGGQRGRAAGPAVGQPLLPPAPAAGARARAAAVPVAGVRTSGPATAPPVARVARARPAAAGAGRATAVVFASPTRARRAVAGPATTTVRTSIAGIHLTALAHGLSGRISRWRDESGPDLPHEVRRDAHPVREVGVGVVPYVDDADDAGLGGLEH